MIIWRGQQATGDTWKIDRGFTAGRPRDCRAALRLPDTGKGRWPANLILSYPEDEYDAEGNLLPNPGKDEVLAGFPVTTSGALNAGHKQCAGSFGKIGGETILRDYGGDTGSAARFFYCG
jgi:hypothetical protein